MAHKAKEAEGLLRCFRAIPALCSHEGLSRAPGRFVAEKGAIAPGASAGEGTEGDGGKCWVQRSHHSPRFHHPSHQASAPDPEDLLSCQNLAKNTLDEKIPYEEDDFSSPEDVTPVWCLLEWWETGL